MYYKNILVVTDNIVQFKKFIELVNSLNLDLSDFTFHCSSHNEAFRDLSSDLPSVTPIDLNKETNYIVDNYDLIFSLHCLQLFPEKLLNSVKCINIHPGYNPINRGWYPQVFAIAHNLPTGATIHEINPEIDNGPIIARKNVPVYSYDTSLTVYERICEAEIDLLKTHLIPILENNYTTFQPEPEGNIFYKKDFNSLCELDLNKTTSLKSCINTLRALTHGKFMNAYFIDENNDKIFVRIVLEKDMSTKK